jgi:hypothetical protein
MSALATTIAPPQTLRRQEAARILGVHPNTVVSWGTQGYFKAISLPNEVRYDAASVDEFRKRIYGE